MVKVGVLKFQKKKKETTTWRPQGVGDWNQNTNTSVSGSEGSCPGLRTGSSVWTFSNSYVPSSPPCVSPVSGPTSRPPHPRPSPTSSQPPSSASSLLFSLRRVKKGLCNCEKKVLPSSLGFHLYKFCLSIVCLWEIFKVLQRSPVTVPRLYSEVHSLSFDGLLLGFERL